MKVLTSLLAVGIAFLVLAIVAPIIAVAQIGNPKQQCLRGCNTAYALCGQNTRPGGNPAVSGNGAPAEAVVRGAGAARPGVVSVSPVASCRIVPGTA